MGRVTLQTIADRVGVSRMTVSNAFSKPDQLSAALREKVLAAADELGYVGPDPAARALARGTSGAIGILMTDSLSYAFTDEVSTGFLGAIADELAPTGLALTLLASTVRSDKVPARDVPMDGALVYSCGLDSTAVDWLIRRGLPIVYVDQIPVPGIPSINVDDKGGARAAAQHLVDLGHRRVAIVNHEPGVAHEVVASRHRRQARVAPAPAGLARAAGGRGHRAGHRRGCRLDAWTRPPASGATTTTPSSSRPGTSSSRTTGRPRSSASPT